MSIAFRRLTEAELPLLHRRLATPLLADIWNHGEVYSLEPVAARYLPRVRGEVPTDPCLSRGNDVPIGREAVLPP